MSHGKIQLAPQSSLGNRVITISRPQHPIDPGDGEDPLFINVIRRRWMLLAFCALLSIAAGLLVISKFSLPKATSVGKLRYVELPPSLAGTYQPPGMIEFTEILMSNETLTELARRTGQEVGPRALRGQLSLSASRFSKIIDIEARSSDPKLAINTVNELMQIACETITTNRRHTLAQYAVETELQYEIAHQRVLTLRDNWMKLRRDYESKQLNGEASSTAKLLAKIERTESSLDELQMRGLSTDRQLATLRTEAEALRQQIKSELIRGRVQQAQSLSRLYNPRSDRHRVMQEIVQRLRELEAEGASTDFSVFRAKFAAIGEQHLKLLDPATSAAVEEFERQLSFAESQIKQIEFDMLPMETNRSLYESRLEALQRQLTDAQGETDMTSVVIDEAGAQLEEAQASRSRLFDHLRAIRQGQETEFEEMTVLTPASWQTTEASTGKFKLLVFTTAGCFMVLVIPVFALEHFYPSGDPAEQAAKSLGIPRVSSDTFVTQRLKRDRSAMHPVNSEAMRLLALRIQQSVHGPGSLVLFSGLNHEKSSIPMISYLAECLARREERVLIIDACDRPQDSHGRSVNDDSVNAVLTPNPAQPHTVDVPPSPSVKTSATPSDKPSATLSESKEPVAAQQLPVNVREPSQPGALGLADFLHQRNVRPEEMICATSIPGVDIIPCGTTSFPREGLASSGLTSLLDECRQRYTMILVAGPSTDHPSDLQMLSARADGILFTVPANGRPAGKGEDVVRDLLEMGAPVIGIVS